MNEESNPDCHGFSAWFDVLAIFSLAALPDLLHSFMETNSTGTVSSSFNVLLLSLIVRSLQVSLPILLIMKLRHVRWASEGLERLRYKSLDGSRLQLAMAIGFLGFFFGAFLCGIGHLLAFMVLEDSFAPPLQPQGNMGQFGFLTVYVGLFGGLAGLSMGLIPYTRFLGWFPVFLLVAFLAAVIEPMDFSTTAGFAMVVVALVMLLMGSVTNLGCRFLLR